MKQKHATVYLTPDEHAHLAALASRQGMKVSPFLRQTVGVILADDGEVSLLAEQERPRRKVTLRLSGEASSVLALEAAVQGVSPSSWASHLLSARLLNAPQPTERERRSIQEVYCQLRELSINANQMAMALNRVVFTGSGYVPSREEVAALRRDVTTLRAALAAYAAGRYRTQIGEVDLGVSRCP